jgi:hypothetical protein
VVRGRHPSHPHPTPVRPRGPSLQKTPSLEDNSDLRSQTWSYPLLGQSCSGCKEIYKLRTSSSTVEKIISSSAHCCDQHRGEHPSGPVYITTLASSRHSKSCAPCQQNLEIAESRLSTRAQPAGLESFTVAMVHKRSLPTQFNPLLAPEKTPAGKTSPREQ